MKNETAISIGVIVMLVVVVILGIVFPISPLNTPDPNFTDLVQTSLKGVVHLQTDRGEGSGFVVGSRLIATARHCVEGVEDFLIMTHGGHQVRATRAISDKEHDVAFIWVDDLECVAGERGTLPHEAVLMPVPLGSIKDRCLGSRIYLIGSPGGATHFNALTTGYISKLDTKPEDFGYSEDYGWARITTIDAVALTGNSGCPVFDMSGRVIGVLVGGPSDALNWIVPVDVFLDDVDLIRLMFAQDRYQREEILEYEYSLYRVESEDY